MADFQTLDDVEQWVQKNGGIEALRLALRRGDFGVRVTTTKMAMLYIEREDRRVADAHEAAERARREREVSAIEASATEAKRSRRWAIVSAVAALLAAFFAALQWLTSK